MHFRESNARKQDTIGHSFRAPISVRKKTRMQHDCINKTQYFEKDNINAAITLSDTDLIRPAEGGAVLRGGQRALGVYLVQNNTIVYCARCFKL